MFIAVEKMKLQERSASNTPSRRSFAHYCEGRIGLFWEKRLSLQEREDAVLVFLEFVEGGMAVSFEHLELAGDACGF